MFVSVLAKIYEVEVTKKMLGTQDKNKMLSKPILKPLVGAIL